MHRHEDDEDDVDDDDDEYDVDDNDQDDNVSGTFAVPASTDYLHLLQHSYSRKHKVTFFIIIVIIIIIEI